MDARGRFRAWPECSKHPLFEEARSLAPAELTARRKVLALQALAARQGLGQDAAPPLIVWVASGVGALAAEMLHYELHTKESANPANERRPRRTGAQVLWHLPTSWKVRLRTLRCTLPALALSAAMGLVCTAIAAMAGGGWGVLFGANAWGGAWLLAFNLSLLSGARLLILVGLVCVPCLPWLALGTSDLNVASPFTTTHFQLGALLGAYAMVPMVLLVVGSTVGPEEASPLSQLRARGRPYLRSADYRSAVDAVVSDVARQLGLQLVFAEAQLKYLSARLPPGSDEAGIWRPDPRVMLVSDDLWRVTAYPPHVWSVREEGGPPVGTYEVRRCEHCGIEVLNDGYLAGSYG